MGGHTTTPRHGHWHDDPGLRLFLIAIAIVIAVFVVAFLVMTESVAGWAAALPL